jgi:hypothetical protein
MAEPAPPLPEPPDTPDLHGFVMTGDAQVFLNHLPMFYVENHCYQLILAVTLSPADHAVYVETAAENRGQPMILGNRASSPMTLLQIVASADFPGEAFVGMPGSPPQPFMTPDVAVGPAVHFAHFDPAAKYPPTLTYYLYGAGGEAHLSHAIACYPDYQHELTLAGVPAGVTPEDLAAGVTISFPALPTPPEPVTADPLLEDRYEVLLPDGAATTIEIAARHYFDATTLNMLPATRKVA